MNLDNASVDDYGASYVGAADLRGQSAVVTISEISDKDFPAKTRDGREYMKKKIILGFAGKNKKLIVNATNREALKFLLGPFLREWIGKRITLVPDQTMFGSSMVPCVRVHPADQPAQIGNGEPKPQVSRELEQHVQHRQGPGPGYTLSTMRPVSETVKIGESDDIAW